MGHPATSFAASRPASYLAETRTGFSTKMTLMERMSNFWWRLFIRLTVIIENTIVESAAVPMFMVSYAFERKKGRGEKVGKRRREGTEGGREKE